MLDDYLTTDEVIEYLRLTRRTVYRLARTGKIPAIRVGHQFRYRRRDVAIWEAANRRLLRHSGTDFAERPRVLVVDDEEAIRNLVVKALAKECEIQAAPDGETAIEYLKAAEYDLLITDLRMPGTDGMKVIRALRKRSAVPVIVLTAFSTEAYAIEALNLGVTGYLTKPFSVDKMVDMAHRFVGLLVESDEAEAEASSIP
jgi:excisionase family DNA binding protein